MVDPTNVKPRFFRSRLIASDSGVVAGTSFGVLGAFSFGTAADELPDVAIEGTELSLHVDKSRGIPDRAFDLQSIANDSGVLHQPLDAVRPITGDFARVESIEGFLIGVPLAQDRDPAQSRLRSLEDEHLEQPPIVVERDAPLMVVVRQV